MEGNRSSDIVRVHHSPSAWCRAVEAILGGGQMFSWFLNQTPQTGRPEFDSQLLTANNVIHSSTFVCCKKNLGPCLFLKKALPKRWPLRRTAPLGTRLCTLPANVHAARGAPYASGESTVPTTGIDWSTGAAAEAVISPLYFVRETMTRRIPLRVRGP